MFLPKNPLPAVFEIAAITNIFSQVRVEKLGFRKNYAYFFWGEVWNTCYKVTKRLDNL